MWSITSNSMVICERRPAVSEAPRSKQAREQSEIEALQGWVGRAQTADDRAAAGPLAGLAGLLDHLTPPWISGAAPPLAHWLYFLPHQRQSLLDADGHAKRGDFLPPVPLPRRMWVGSRVRFLAPIPIDAAMRRRSTIATVKAKSGRTGPMVFVTVKHEITVGGTTAVVEEQDIVYRGAATQSGSAAPAVSAPTASGAPAPTARQMPRVSQATRTITPDPVQLFRFSALTFNAHRIHYDRDYARNVEGYPGLVVHGPLVATLLMDHFLRHSGGRSVSAFSFRAERPLFDTAPFDVCFAPSDVGADLWAIDVNGATAFTAAVEAL
jgi:3-methylfumaryl-CoA hydratase